MEPKDLCRVRKNMQICHIMSQMSPVRNFPSYFFKIHFNPICVEVFEVVAFFQYVFFVWAPAAYYRDSFTSLLSCYVRESRPLYTIFLSSLPTKIL
jgi:hypothetical protein